MSPSIAVVVSSWEGHSRSFLRRLVASMKCFDAGMAYDLVVSANSPDFAVPEDLAGVFRHILRRENVGFNLGAWDHAWRRLPEYDYYLFMQDDCFVRRKNWLRRFSQRFAKEKDCGLVGEHFNSGWNRPWDELLGLCTGEYNVSAQKSQRAARYLHLLKQWGVPAGHTAAHLTTVVQFTSRRLLEEVDGYPIRAAYQEAIAAEIGFSRKIVAAGYCLRQLERWRHSYIGHPQWPSESLWERIRPMLRNNPCREVL